MASNENMVNDNFDEGMDEDFLQLVGEDQQDEPEEEYGESFETILNEDGEEGQTETEQVSEEQDEDEDQGDRGTREPGYVRKRVDKAVAKARAEMQAEFDRQRSEMQAEFERQMAPIRARMEEDEAQALVSSRKVSDIELAREIVRLRHGQPAQTETKPAEQQEQPRNERGQFTEKAQSDDLAAATNYLAGQAKRIQAETGIDVMAVFNGNAEIRNKVLSGEMDFRDVAKQYGSQKRRPPAPMRTPNKTDGQIRGSIMDLTDEQFERLEKRVKEQG